jgi:hypothetical protein
MPLLAAWQAPFGFRKVACRRRTRGDPSPRHQHGYRWPSGEPHGLRSAREKPLLANLPSLSR